MVACQRSDGPSQQRQEPDDFYAPRGHGSSPVRTASHYQRLQFRRMYRYGLSLLLVGALCNWIGFAQHYFAPVRYLGVGCVVAGALCICIALGRWLSLRSHDSSANQEISSCGTVPSIHVIAVPVQGVDPFQTQQASMVSKPPDYETAIGSKPPSYDEAVRISPAVLLQAPLNTEAHAGPGVATPIDCSR